jgi:3,4-dihydroxy 2-butanone 4-phosphate synthase/GTP cyclohydrolase II
MVARNGAQYSTGTVSIGGHEGVTTGISAASRSRTVRTAVATRKTCDLVDQPHLSAANRRWRRC